MSLWVEGGKLRGPADSPMFPFPFCPKDQQYFKSAWQTKSRNEDLMKQSFIWSKKHQSHKPLRSFLVLTKPNLAYLLWCRRSSFCKGLLFRFIFLQPSSSASSPFIPCWLLMNLNMKQVGKCNLLGCAYKISITLLIQVGIFWISWELFL